MNKLFKLLLIISVLIVVSCSREEFQGLKAELTGQYKLNLSGEISGTITTKADNNGFADGDEVGIYVVDYDGNTKGTLANNGNRADNVRYTFNASDWSWTGASDVYFKDRLTAVDIYGYYPFDVSLPTDVHKYAFEVAKDQSTSTSEDGLGGYESSDFLWGNAENIAPTSDKIKLGFKHIMAGVRVSLVEGTGFSSGEWAGLDKKVVIGGTRLKSSIDLATGTVSVDGTTSISGIIPVKDGNDFRAVVVPQDIVAEANLISVTVAGFPYILRKSSLFSFRSGKQHNFTLTVNKKTQSGAYEVVLSNESITVWQPDDVSHDATAKAYVVINVDKAGTLDTCIAKSGKDLTKIKNLKLTGEIDARDFAVMKFKMNLLSSLNLKDVTIVAGTSGQIGGEGGYYGSNENDEIPINAMSGKFSLSTLVLPDKLVKICYGSFDQCKSLSGSLIIPEGVKVIENRAFHDNFNLNGTLSLPSTLEQIGSIGNDNAYAGVFGSCSFVGELKIPDNVKIIGDGAFYECKGLTGSLRFPEKLEGLGQSAFETCTGLSGSIEIPQGVSVVPQRCFAFSGFNGTLSLHDGISSIGSEAFSGASLKGELRLPKHLETISPYSFYGCDFSGLLVLPVSLRSIGSYAFTNNWRLMGVLDIPENVTSIGDHAFAGCRMIEGLSFPADMESIRNNAFENCFGIGSIVCRGSMPALVQDGAFNGVPKDNFTLEVPESAIAQYQVSSGWKDFKRISAYRNFVIRPNVATAINTTASRDLILNADGAWTVESKPDWVTLSQTSGNLKTSLKLTFAQMPLGISIRKDSVVFKLKDKEYRTKCYVSQYDYKYSEDQIITLNSATKGEGVNVVILGDGYNAKDISEGKLMSDIKQTMEYFFAIEPYKTYKDYFNVYTGISVSPESGIGSINTIINNKFNTSAKGGNTLGGRNTDGSDYKAILEYTCKAPTVSTNNIGETLVIIVPNTSDYGGITYMYDDGSAIAYCPKSNYGYPLDWRGVIQHEAGGHGFGKLGDEYIYHNAFIDACPCTCCPHVMEFMAAKNKGWYANMELTGKIQNVGWSHLAFDSKYSSIVDIYEGGFMHSRGVFRSEQNSCMNNDIPYYSTISREAIVKRIMMIAGEGYSFAKFKANDVTDASTTSSASTKSLMSDKYQMSTPVNQHPPVMLGRRPKLR